MPAYCFRKFCAGNKSNRSEYPREIRNMRFETRKYESILDELIDLKGLKISNKGVKKVKKNEIDDEERFKLGKNTSI